MNIREISRAALGITALTMILTQPVSAQQTKPHDSNTLHKVGNAIEYVFRKAGNNVTNNTHQVAGKDAVKKETTAVQYVVRKDSQNVAVETHKAEGKKSITHDSNGNAHVVTPLPHNKRKHLFP